MDTFRKLSLLFATALLAVALVATPVLADDVIDDAEDDAEVEVIEGDPDAADDDGRPALAETPRDRLGLLLFGAMAAAGIIGWIGMRRQLGGEHSQATGEFRWR